MIWATMDDNYDIDDNMIWQQNLDNYDGRHARSILIDPYISCWPCGIVVLFEELHGSESISQVYGIVVEWLASLDEEALKKLLYFLYDDCCHFMPFAQVKLYSTFFKHTKFIQAIINLRIPSEEKRTSSPNF